MKKFNENIESNIEENEDSLDYLENSTIENENSNECRDEKVLRTLENDNEKDEYITPDKKKFRLIIGLVCLISCAFMMFSTGTSKRAYKDNITSGLINNVNAGEILSKDIVDIKAEDETVKIANGYGNLEIQVWNFVNKEDYDYVQVFIDGTPTSEPFAIRHKPVKISVPDKAVITVQGVRDGSNNGITYAVSFNKTGETYLNKVNLNGTNTYTIISD